MNLRKIVNLAILAAMVWWLVLPSFNLWISVTRYEPQPRGESVVKDLDELLTSHSTLNGFQFLRVSATADGKPNMRTFRPKGLPAEYQIDAKTMYPLGSISKTVVASIFLELFDQQALSPSEPICHYLHSLCTNHPELTGLTVADLLSHKSGITDDGEFFSNFLHILPSRDQVNEALAQVTRELKLTYDENAKGKFNYSNRGFLILSRVLEVALKRPFLDIVRDHLAEYGILDAQLVDRNEEGLCCSYYPIRLPFYSDFFFRSAIESDYSDLFGDGGILVRAEDVYKLARSPVFNQDLSPVAVKMDETSYYQNGIVLGRTAQEDFYHWHNGQINSWWNFLVHLHDGQIIYLASNSSDASKDFEQFEDSLYELLDGSDEVQRPASRWDL